ncbi:MULTISPECIES: hypothetical protein [unclassified Leptolyngbya]|uniref:hypothetical protein n=1 Tax=unclassified Leptolyngbya TaxID=2650499 RepID=UPI001687ECC1|nr:MULTISPECIES: hypothetical protein [unclassified Leptolyngbya]MBD1912409.1 hypothetical protein [Leptolyngbya sp. FACHB-8]MBD2157910.1 hypothetical protein [Leptolyngbya sp. FACHB-16]
MFKRKSVTPGTATNKVLAVLAVVNLGLVAFDWSYIPWRDSYLRYMPGFTQWYGATFKGIEPHRDTDTYLNQVERLQKEGLNAQETAALLTNLRDRSVAMVDENPFAAADKTGTLERIKNRMRDHMDEESSKDAFQRFWSRSYLSQAGFDQELDYFNDEIRPLMASNYYRGFNNRGNLINRFWILDLPFVVIFASDFLVRTFRLSRRYKGTNWFDAMLWRWYDIPLFLPFWRGLRVISTLMRIHESRLINLTPVRDRLTRGLAASFAIELTEVVVLRVIEQMQDLISQKELTHWLLDPNNRRRYVDINGVDEAEAIARQLITLTVYQVLPNIRPELEALIRYSVSCVLEQSPFYRNLAQVPGLKDIPDQLGERLVSDLTQTAYDSLTTALEKPEGLQLTRNLINRVGTTFRSEIYENNTLENLENLVIDLLEEFKVNYIQNLSEQDLDTLRQETHHRFYEITQSHQLAIRPEKMRQK